MKFLIRDINKDFFQLDEVQITRDLIDELVTNTMLLFRVDPDTGNFQRFRANEGKFMDMGLYVNPHICQDIRRERLTAALLGEESPPELYQQHC